MSLPFDPEREIRAKQGVKDCQSDDACCATGYSEPMPEGTRALLLSSADMIRETTGVTHD